MDSPTVLAPTVEELPEVIEMLQEVLRRDQNYSITKEFPIALSAANIPNMRIIRDGDKIVSHALYYPLTLGSGDTSFRCAAIGSVATRESHRKQGLSSLILQNILRQLNIDGYDFGILWTDQYDHYRKYHFELAGTEYAYDFVKPIPETDSTIEVAPFERADVQSMYAAYMQHNLKHDRSLQEFVSYLTIPSKIMVAKSSGVVVAYAACGKGADFPNYIHEWAGDPQGVIAIANALKSEIESDQILTMIMPADSPDMIKALGNIGLQPRVGFLGMIRITSLNFLQKVQTRIKQDVPDFILREEGGEFLVGTEKHHEKVSAGQAIRAIFGPNPFSDVIHIDADTAKIIDKALPLPLWLWGFDSV